MFLGCHLCHRYCQIHLEKCSSAPPSPQILVWGGLQAPCPPCSAAYYFLCPTNSGKKALRHLERNTGTTGLQIEVLLLTMF